MLFAMPVHRIWQSQVDSLANKIYDEYGDHIPSCLLD